MDFHRITIPFAPDRVKLLASVGVEADSEEAEDFLALLEQALPHAHPKAILGEAAVEAVEEGGRVRVGGLEFQSRLLAKNLKNEKTVWPHLATCGRELYDFVMTIPDPFERFWGEAIMQQALSDVRAAMENVLAERFYSGKTASMGPGSLPDWPITEQIPLFRLLGEAADFCGVTLTESMLMLPNKSVSGLRFPNEHGYVNCALCPRDRCPNRKAVYDKAAVEMMGV